MLRPPDSPQPPPPAPRTWLVAGLVLGLAAWLRFAAIGKLELWFDECGSILTALAPEGVLRAALRDTNPPLYHYLLRGWIGVFGISAVAVRSLSAVAGVLQLGIMGMWLMGLGLSRRATLAAMLLGALAPLHIYYSQETRAYALLMLLATLALWSFTAAVRDGRRRIWALHGVCLLLAFYTNDLFAFAIPWLWPAAWLLGSDRRGWGRLAATHVVAGALCAPWAMVTLRAVGHGGLAWFGASWETSMSWALIPQSIEILATGGRHPVFVRMMNPSFTLRLLGLAWLVAVVAMAARAGPRGALRGAAMFLACLTLGPLLLMVVYSLAATPMYVAGRYDTLVYPPLLGLLGMGAGGLIDALARRTRDWAAIAAAMLVPGLIALTTVPEKWYAFPPDLLHHPQQARGELLRDYARKEDLIVCMGLEGVRIGYQMKLYRIDAQLVTFPSDIRPLQGYFRPEEAAAQPDRLWRDAQAIAARFKGQGESRRRLFVALSPEAFRSPTPGGREGAYTTIASVLLDALEAAGLEAWREGDFRRRSEYLGLRAYVPAGANQEGFSN